jgi:hypothetical protein
MLSGLCPSARDSTRNKIGKEQAFISELLSGVVVAAGAKADAFGSIADAQQ